MKQQIIVFRKEIYCMLATTILSKCDFLGHIKDQFKMRAPLLLYNFISAVLFSNQESVFPPSLSFSLSLSLTLAFSLPTLPYTRFLLLFSLPASSVYLLILLQLLFVYFLSSGHLIMSFSLPCMCLFFL